MVYKFSKDNEIERANYNQQTIFTTQERKHGYSHFTSCSDLRRLSRACCVQQNNAQADESQSLGIINEHKNCEPSTDFKLFYFKRTPLFCELFQSQYYQQQLGQMEGDSEDNMSNMSYSDEEELAGKEEEFDLAGQESGSTVDANEQEGLSKTEVGSLELIYIMFRHYRKECDEIAFKANCKIRFSISSYTLEQVGECSKQQFTQCLQQLNQFLRSIILEEIRLFPDQITRVKFFTSPYIHEEFEKKKIKLARFHEKVYGFSRELGRDKLKSQFGTIIKPLQIFSVRTKRMGSNRSANSYLPRIYEHIEKYIELMLQHNETFFQDRELVATFNERKNYVLIHGKRGKYLMEAKTLIKNIVESLVCLFVKDTHVEYKTMGKYLKKATLYPVHFAKFSNNIAIVISKDNILKQLINKSASFMKYIGLEMELDQTQTSVDPSVGFYILPSNSLELKMEKIREKAQLKNHDVYSHLGIRYLKKVFIQAGKKVPHEYKQLLVDILVCVEENKMKFDMPRPKPKEELIPKQIDDGLKYQVISGKGYNEELSKELKRDVLCERVQMKKKYLIAYNILETKEEMAYWKYEQNSQEGPEVAAGEIKKGVYFRGSKKFNEKGEEVVNFEEIVTIL